MTKKSERELLRPEPPALVSLFSVALVSCILIGMTLGDLISRDARSPALVAGVIGLAFYLYRLRRAEQEYVNRVDEMGKS
jgi:hypothetical protein